MVTVTTSDGVSETTRRLVAEQAISELRALKRARAAVTLDAGARQVVRMTLARPLVDDPVLLGGLREMAAVKVVGSGVDASAIGTGKTISSGRAVAHRASAQPGFRGLVVAEGRLLELGDRPGVVLAANSVLDRSPADLQAIPWHLLIADEALPYANAATEAQQALVQLRFGSVADSWLLTATPRGKSAEHLDVVGLAVGDEAMRR